MFNLVFLLLLSCLTLSLCLAGSRLGPWIGCLCKRDRESPEPRHKHVSIILSLVQIAESHHLPTINEPRTLVVFSSDRKRLLHYEPKMRNHALVHIFVPRIDEIWKFFYWHTSIEGSRTSPWSRQHHTLPQSRHLPPNHEPGTVAVFSSDQKRRIHHESEKRHRMEETTLARSPTIFYPHLRTSDISTGLERSPV